MKKLPLFITACLLVSFFSGCDKWRSSSKHEPQPEKLKSNTHTRSPSVACSANGKIVYWISNDPDNHNRIVMYKSTDGGENWIEIKNPYPPAPEWTEFDYDPKSENVNGGERKAVPIPRNGK